MRFTRDAGYTMSFLDISEVPAVTDPEVVGEAVESRADAVIGAMVVGERYHRITAFHVRGFRHEPILLHQKIIRLHRIAIDWSADLVRTIVESALADLESLVDVRVSHGGARAGQTDNRRCDTNGESL
ncbi:hypothetical protein ACL02S_01865 [Nocardia sp. 004]|uniref:hypothetical protein n=1 Tax=Nocardia sp. 004 TaxID=3385978 RepID=UPI0039A326DC